MSEKKKIIRINAGAGAGKTLVVVLRVINLLLKGAKPEEILLISFTKNAAAEMRARIKLYAEDFGIEEDLSHMRIQTFNAFGDDILKLKHEDFGFSKPPRVIGNIDRSRIINQILDEHEKIDGLDYRNYTLESRYTCGALPMVEKIFQIIKKNRYGKGDGELIKEKLKKSISVDTIEEVIDLYDDYDNILRDESFIEFADQESMIFELFDRDPFFVDSLGIRYIIVDEFQDTNKQEIEILKLLRDTACFENLMCVGDDSQAIYGDIKDTTPDYIRNLDTVFGEEIENIDLLINYRSQANIIDFANKINDLNIHKIDKALIPARPAGKPVVVRGFLDDQERLDYVVEMVEKKLDEGYNPEDIAILTRNNPQLQRYVDLLTKKGIPTEIGGYEVILENCRVKAAVGFFNVMQDKANTSDLLKYVNAKLHGGLMDKTEEEIAELCDDALAEIEALEAYDEEEKKEEIMRLLRALDSNEDEIFNGFLDDIELRPTAERMTEYVDAYQKYGQKEKAKRSKVYPGVKLMTAFASKGLEWPVVFNDINEYESDRIPRYGESDASEETRRLYFVSATRARDELYVVANYVAYGPARDHVYNRYLKESYDIVGQKFDASSIEAQIKEKKARQKAERDLKKKEEAKQKTDSKAS